jgi:LPXTG-motif cell wall-anchored protein
VTAPARTVRVAGADQLARTGIDSGTAAGAAVLLLVIGGASVYAARRRAVWA